MQIPSGSEAQRRLLRFLMNVRMPGAIDADFLKIQDEYLAQVNFEKGIVDLEDIAEIQRDTYVWRGDITRLASLHSKRCKQRYDRMLCAMPQLYR